MRPYASTIFLHFFGGCSTTRYVSFKTGMSVRLSPELRQRLERVASCSGLKAADLIRMAVEQYCNKVEEAGELTIKIVAEKPATSRPRNPKPSS